MVSANRHRNLRLAGPTQNLPAKPATVDTAKSDHLRIHGGVALLTGWPGNLSGDYRHGCLSSDCGLTRPAQDFAPKPFLVGAAVVRNLCLHRRVTLVTDWLVRCGRWLRGCHHRCIPLGFRDPELGGVVEGDGFVEARQSPGKLLDRLGSTQLDHRHGLLQQAVVAELLQSSLEHVGLQDGCVILLTLPSWHSWATSIKLWTRGKQNFVRFTYMVQ